MLMALGFSRDGSMIVSGGDSVRVHDLATGEMLHEARPANLTRAVAFSPAERDVFVSSGQDGLVRFWRLKWNRPFRTLKEHKAGVLALAYSPDGKFLASAATGNENGKPAKGELRLWETESGELVRSENARDASFSCVAFSSDGKLIAFAKNASDNQKHSSVEVYEVENWKKLRSIEFSPGFANAVALSPEVTQVLIAGGECVGNDAGGCVPTGRIWIADGADKVARELDDLGTQSYFQGALFFDDKNFVTGTTVLVAPEEAIHEQLVPELQIRDAQTGKLVWSRGEEGGPAMYGASASPDRKFIAGCTSSTIFIFDARTRKLVRAIGLDE